MIDQEQEQAVEIRLRRAGIAAFAAGLVGTLAFFAFFPGLPHVIDWGAIVTALIVGALARWACQSWMRKRGASHS
ncbi:hypothetical protein H9Y04_35300 [Streptomyces sp. TRM66268-LWL]|uniref:Uncharacterized protein n=1 Tax=Streptomyces polyasparticus TaxID=2767826 RepID=A0ABR7SQP0_9ACTN|nr:hypothetical protein [Streptomyces polyasparticus]MBC9717811.1 hypothetical protein [Streptomyces polyasparticus]